MSEKLKLDVNIAQKDIARMLKQAIKEVIESDIQKALDNIDVDSIIQKNISSKLNNIMEKQVKDYIYDLQTNSDHHINKVIREIVLKKIQEKPLTGNVYLKIDNYNVETDYDY